MRDKEAGQPQIAPEVEEQIQDLRLDRNIERGHRLVADQHIGPHGQRAGDGHALPLPAGELVREALRKIRIKTDAHEPVGHQRATGRARDDAMRDRALGDAVTNPLPRIEGGEGVLEHRLDAGRDLVASLHRRCAIQQNAARGGSQDAGEDAPQRGFATAALTHQAERFALVQGERYIRHGLHRTPIGCGAEGGGDPVTQ